MIWVVVDKIWDRFVLREDHSVSKRCQRSCLRWPLPQITQKYISVWYGIDLSIPSLYCGAKYCRSGSKSDMQLLKTEPEKESESTRPVWHAGKATLNAHELLEKDEIPLLLRSLLYRDRNTHHDTCTNTTFFCCCSTLQI